MRANLRTQSPVLVTFVGGDSGDWRVERMNAVRGLSLPKVERIRIFEGKDVPFGPKSKWILRGLTSHQRYTEKSEHNRLKARQPPLARPQATCAALIPIRKSEAWWNLSQDERRKIFEERSHHIATGLKYLPAIARRLLHSRDLGEAFDFLTWFEYAPAHTDLFEELLAKLRKTLEWSYVVRELDIRLTRY